MRRGEGVDVVAARKGKKEKKRKEREMKESYCSAADGTPRRGRFSCCRPSVGTIELIDLI